MERKRNITIACPGCKKNTCDGCKVYDKLNTNKQVPVKFPKDFLPEKQAGLGISFDVGTTTLAGMLWDLETGALLGVETMKNPQTKIGADVISRMQYALGSLEKLKYLQKILIDSLDLMAKKLLADFPNDNVIQKAVVVGNTPMCEILMGIKPEGIAVAPFMPDYRNTVYEPGMKLGFEVIKNAEIIVLPPIGGYVGSDALAVYHCVSAQIPQMKENWSDCHPDMAESEATLAVDIGTNGEILLKYGDEFLACSTAAGPALEGGAINQGMRATKGAIEKVGVSGGFPMQDIVCKVIGDETPKGICGSGLIDAAAVLYQLGVIDETGYLRTQKEAKAAGVPEKICRRLTNRKADADALCHFHNENCFLLTNTESPVYLTAGDIRQLQLSMGAIRAGIEVLLAKAGIKAADVSRFYIAGAFGSYIDIAGGKTVGLFPDIPTEKIVQAGNLASTGAAMALLSAVELKKMEAEAKQLTHVELADEETFEKLFLQHMNFPLY